MTAEEFRGILDAPEGTRLEFKTAANRYDFDELVRYCVAIANEGGGLIVLGVTDTRPRRVVGTAAFPEPGQTESSIFQRVGHHAPAFIRSTGVCTFLRLAPNRSGAEVPLEHPLPKVKPHEPRSS